MHVERATLTRNTPSASKSALIVLRNQVFNRLRALKLLSASHELAGDNSNRRRSFSTWGKIDFTFEGKLMITKIKGEIQYFYGTFQYISTFSIIYGQNPNFNEKIESYNTKKWGGHLIFRPPHFEKWGGLMGALWGAEGKAQILEIHAF